MLFVPGRDASLMPPARPGERGVVSIGEWLPAAWECDLRDGALRWSPGVYTLFGMPPDMPLVRDRIVGLYDDASRQTLERLRAAAIRDGGSFTFEATIRRLNGERRRMLLTADIAFEKGRPCRLYGLKQDVTGDQDPAP